MKRLLHLLLALALLATLTLPVSAAGAEDRLTQVTLKVKETLGIGDKYDTFSGDLQESIRPFWSLHWSGGEQGLEVVAGEDGKIHPSRHASYVAMYNEVKDLKEWEMK